MKFPRQKTLIASAIALAFATPSFAKSEVWIYGKPWQPRQTLNVQAGSGWQDDYDLLLPLAGSARQLFFANGGLAASTQYSGGDIGLGYRQLVNHKRNVLSGYALLGRYRGKYHSLFTQATLGVESLSRSWDMRAHAYIPLGGKRTILNSQFYNLRPTGYKIIGNRTDSVETIQDGFDFELGRALPNMPELRAFAGYYHYGWGGGKDNLDGAQIRAEYRYNDYLTLTASEQYDHKRGHQATLGLRLSLGQMHLHHYDAVDRMTEYLYRRRGIYTTHAYVDGGFISPENFYYANNSASGGGNGTYEFPFQTVEAAEAASLDGNLYTNYVYIYGTGVDYTLNPAQLTLGANQIFMGSGGDLIYRGNNVIASNGQTPTLIGGLIANSHDEIAYINLDGQNNSLHGNGGIYANGVDQLNIHDVNISNYTAADGTNGANGTAGYYAPLNLDAMNGTDGGNGGNGADAYGIKILNSSNLIISNVNITNLTAGNGGTGGNGGQGANGPNNVTNGGHGGNAGNGGNGGNAYGIEISSSTNAVVQNISVANLTAGNAQAGGAGGTGGDALNGVADFTNNGGNGGNAYGLSSINSSYSSNNLTYSVTYSQGTGAAFGAGTTGGTHAPAGGVDGTNGIDGTSGTNGNTGNSHNAP